MLRKVALYTVKLRLNWCVSSDLRILLKRSRQVSRKIASDQRPLSQASGGSGSQAQTVKPRQLEHRGWILHGLRSHEELGLQ